MIHTAKHPPSACDMWLFGVGMLLFMDTTDALYCKQKW